MEHNLEELNKLEEQILETQKLLEEKEFDDSLTSTYKMQRNIFAILALLFLAGFIYSYFFNKDRGVTNSLKKENISLIDNDSLTLYRTSYFNNINTIANNSNTDLSSLDKEKIIYSVQIGAFKEFDFTSKGLMNLSEFQKNGYNKFSIGTYKTYAEAKVLKDSLIKLGFRDCFLSAKSFGNPINIRKALSLSNEPQFLEQ